MSAQVNLAHADAPPADIELMESAKAFLEAIMEMPTAAFARGEDRPERLRLAAAIRRLEPEYAPGRTFGL